MSAAPDFVAISRLSFAIEAWLVSISSVGMAGSVSIGGCGAAGGGPAGGASSSSGTKPRSRTVRSASPVSGSPFPTTSRRPARVAGVATRAVTSTNSLPPASYIRGSAVSWKREIPSGFMASVIICW